MCATPCSAGYKGIYQDGVYPDREFLAALNPAFAGCVQDKLDHQIGQLGHVAGTLTAQAAGRDHGHLDLPRDEW